MSTSSVSDVAGDMWSGLGTGIATSVINGTIGLFTNKQNYDNSVALWKMNNEYNTPKAQMQRLAEAGLNPNLVYGGGTVTGNTSSQPSAPTLQVPRFAIDYTQAMLGKNLKKMDAEIEGMQERNKYIKEQLRGLVYNNNLFLDSGLPLNSPWYAKALSNLAKEWSSDPEKVNILKGVGADLFSLFNPLSTLKGFQPGFDIHGKELPDWVFEHRANQKYGE